MGTSSKKKKLDNEFSFGEAPPTEESNTFDFPNPPIPEPNQQSVFEPSKHPFGSIAIPNTSRIKQTWSIGGGKGGVGKSLIASCLAMSLARTGNKVICIDLDLGGANLHSALGISLPRNTLSDFFTGRASHLADCVSTTNIDNLEIISGAHDATTAANINNLQKEQLFQKIWDLNADYIVFDLGAGTNLNTLDFFLFTDIGIITLLPEPTSIENAYRFIKSVYYRRLQVSPRLNIIQPLVETAMDSKNNQGIKSPANLFQEVSRAHPESMMQLKKELEKFSPKLILNQARTQTDVDIGFSIKSVVKQYFGVDIDYVGYLDYDSAAWQSIRRKKPLMKEFPNSRIVTNIERISTYLMRRHSNIRNYLF